LKIEVRRGETVEGNKTPMVTKVTNKESLLTVEAIKNAAEESAKSRESIRGDEKPRCREMKSINGVRRSPEVPAADTIDLSSGVPLN
jgi:hypothetical protein